MNAEVENERTWRLSQRRVALFTCCANRRKGGTDYMTENSYQRANYINTTICSTDAHRELIQRAEKELISNPILSLQSSLSIQNTWRVNIRKSSIYFSPSSSLRQIVLEEIAGRKPLPLKSILINSLVQHDGQRLLRPSMLAMGERRCCNTPMREHSIVTNWE